MFSMPFILSKMLSLGLSLTDAISATTEKPAKWIGMEGQDRMLKRRFLCRCCNF